MPALEKTTNPSGVTGIVPQVQDTVSKAAQQAAEAVVKQGGSKEQANAAAQKAAAAAVTAANKLQKENPNATPADLSNVAKDAAAPVVNALSKNKDANVSMAGCRCSADMKRFSCAYAIQGCWAYGHVMVVSGWHAFLSPGICGQKFFWCCRCP